MRSSYVIVLTSGHYSTHNTRYLRTYSTRESALEPINALAAEILKFEAEYKKARPGAKFSVYYEVKDNFVELSVAERARWILDTRLPCLIAMSEYIASTPIGKEFHPELWDQEDPFDGEFSITIQQLPFIK